MTAGAVAALVLGYDASLLFAAMAIAAPWIQAVGRLRCLIQGCCHGREAPEWLGIRYWDQRSRVCSFGGLRGKPLHPTPLYSMVACLMIGVMGARLWSLGASEGMIIGVYLLLSGLCRFVEESYRGEPQTPWVANLRLYQWLAIVLIVAGAITTTLAGSPVPATGLSLAAPIVGFSMLFALVCLFAFGIDFPKSTRRFARLAPVE